MTDISTSQDEKPCAPDGAAGHWQVPGTTATAELLKDGTVLFGGAHYGSQVCVFALPVYVCFTGLDYAPERPTLACMLPRHLLVEYAHNLLKMLQSPWTLARLHACTEVAS